MRKPAKGLTKCQTIEETEYLVDAEDFGEVLVRTPKHIEAQSGGFRPGDRVLIGWQADAALALSES